MTYEDQLQQPHVEKIGGQDVQFHRLDCDDLDKWAAQIRAKKRADETSRVRSDPALNGKEEMRQRLIQAAGSEDVEYGELWRRSFTPAGAKRILVDSLKKGSMSDGDAVAVLKKLHWTDQQRIAGIVMSPPAPTVEGEQSGPPAQGGDVTDGSNAP